MADKIIFKLFLKQIKSCSNIVKFHSKVICSILMNMCGVDKLPYVTPEQ